MNAKLKRIIIGHEKKTKNFKSAHSDLQANTIGPVKLFTY